MPDEIYHLEVKKKFIGSDWQDEFHWVVRPVTDVIADHPPEYRCKDCNGKVKLHGKHVPNGPVPRGAYVKTGFRVLPFWNVLPTKPRTYTETVAQPN